MNPLLLVIDMQNGFVNHNSDHVIANVVRLLETFQSSSLPVAFTRFRNYDNSPWVRWIKWTRFITGPEIELIASLQPPQGPVFDKTTYTSLTPELLAFTEKSGVDTFVLCGIATDGCVLKTAVDVFERGLQPVVLADACASHAGTAVHDAGLLLIRRFIGTSQVRTVDDFLSQLHNPRSDEI